MKRQAFVFEGSSWRSGRSGEPSLTQEYSEWVNNLLQQFPDAKFEFHQSIAPFFWEREESEWVHLYTLAIVTEQE